HEPVAAALSNVDERGADEVKRGRPNGARVEREREFVRGRPGDVAGFRRFEVLRGGFPRGESVHHPLLAGQFMDMETARSRSETIRGASAACRGVSWRSPRICLITDARSAPCCSASLTRRSSMPAEIAALETSTRCLRSFCHSSTHTFTAAASVTSTPSYSVAVFVAFS